MKILKNFIRSHFPEFQQWAYDTFKGPKRYRHLYNSINATKAKNILEVGVWNGARAVKMIRVAKKHNPKISYYGFDLFEELTEDMYKEELSKRPPSKQVVEELLSTTGADIHLFTGNTLQSLPEAVPNLPKMDFIFIDGGHSNETILCDWNAVKQLMHEGTIVLFDDYWQNRTDGGCKQTVDSLDTAKYKVEILPETDIFDNTDFGKLEINFAKVTFSGDKSA